MRSWTGSTSRAFSKVSRQISSEPDRSVAAMAADACADLPFSRGGLMRRMLVLVAVTVSATLLLLAQSKTLETYVIDVEGGNATLFVTPSREAVLIDTGNVGPAAPRDANRIMAAVRDAGLSQIDALVTSHWHGDHMGAMAELADRVPIRHYIDHGANVQPSQ